MRKKILAMLLAAVMVMALLPTAFAELPSSTEEAISYIGWDRSENDGVDYYVEEPITLSEFGELRSINGYNVLSQETQLTVSNLADAEDDCYIRVDLLMYEKETNGNYWVFPANFYLTDEGDFEQLFMSDDWDNYSLKLRPGESVTFSLLDFGSNSRLLQLTATLIYSDYEISWWWRRCYIVDDEEANRLRQEQTGTSSPEEPTEPEPPAFTDVPEGAYYADAVSWAVDNGITKGTGGGKFSPEKTCSEGEILTMLYRASKETAAAAAPIPVASYYQDAVNWAYEKGMIDGSFDPDKPCDRASAVYYIWQAIGKESAPAQSFTDVDADADYADAVSWAVTKGITNGTGGGKFSPVRTCMREEIVTLLYRAYALSV